MSRTMTRTYVIMEVTLEVYREIEHKLLDAGYNHAIHKDRNYKEGVLDMHGIALAVKPEEPERVVCGCRIPPGWIPRLEELLPPAKDCPFCDGTGFLIRTVPKADNDDG